MVVLYAGFRDRLSKNSLVILINVREIIKRLSSFYEFILYSLKLTKIQYQKALYIVNKSNWNLVKRRDTN